MKQRNIEILKKIGVQSNSFKYLLAGAAYLEKNGGPNESVYWNDIPGNTLTRLRDEYFVTGIAITAIYNLIAKTRVNSEWRGEFDVSFLWQFKPLMQSFYSVDHLCAIKSYQDATTILRTIHSRVQQIILFSLNPFLFNYWLHKPKDEMFLDGHIRKEISKHKLYLYPHFYEWLSESVHGHEKAQLEIGYFEKGIFPEVSNVEISIYIIGKFLLGVAGWVGLCVVLEDANDEIPKDHREALVSLYGQIKNVFMAHNRIDQIFTIIAEDRHLEKTGKNKFTSKLFDLDNYQRQLALFHRKSKPKSLSSKYHNHTFHSGK